ncbi:hypothetical protein [Roseateles sp. DAIF2]|uniref:hypothetical protein n=1 Tax=Roseateles sp. DAIF2 TaxID=2714952 RepID=UPI00201E43C6|nr:hypothetical protein [Roseateles sp. DAIF2]
MKACSPLALPALLMAISTWASAQTLTATPINAVDHTAPAFGARVFDGYDSFYQALGPTLFAATDERARVEYGIGQPAGDFWKWPSNKKINRPHVMELRGADLLINGRHLPAIKAKRFDGEHLAPALGRDATVYANDRYVCVQGISPGASGTAVRHIRVTLVTNPYQPNAKRFELPSLFASCLGLFDGSGGAVLFYSSSYRWPENAEAPQGVSLQEQILTTNGSFKPTGRTIRTTFVEAGNVYRFTSP